MLKYSCVLLFSLFLICGSELILKPGTPAFVKKGQKLKLICQSKELGGLFGFFTFDVEGRRISLGVGVGSLNYCVSHTNHTSFECDFEEGILTFKLTLLNPIHNQTIECSRAYNRTTLSTNTTIFVQVPVSTLTLSTHQTTVRASRSINITCRTNDLVRPAANITWYKENSEIFTQITTSIQHDANDLYRTVSVLQYTGVPEDNGQQVYCSASNIEGEHVESSRYTLNVTSKPIKPTIILVECDVTSATIVWTVSTSLNFRYTPPFQQETLQLSEQNEGFLNCSFEKIETNLSTVYIYRATDLNPSTEYKFRIVASNVRGSSFSDSHACYTAEKHFTSKSKDCDKGLIICGSLGGAFILIILSGGSAFFIYLQINRKKQQTAERNDHYVQHICSTNEHQYQDISDQNKGAVKPIERAEYMELSDKIYTNDDGQ